MPITTLLPTVTALFLDAVRANAILTRVANRDLDPAPAQQGDVLNVRLPVSVAPKDVTPSAAPETPQAASTTPASLTLNRWRQRDMALTDKELSDIEAGNIPQQMNQLAVDMVENINADGYITAIRGAGFAVNTAAPGSTPFATDDAPFRAGLAQLDRARASRNRRVGIFNVDAYWAGLALPNIAQADRRGDAANPLVTGEVISSYGAAFLSDQLLPAQTTAALGAGALTANGVNALGATTVSIAKGAGANVALVAGDVITIAGHIRSYVVAANVTVVQGANTAVTITQGLAQATVGGEAITLIGAGTTYQNSLIMNPEGLYFASRPLLDLEGAGNTYSLSDPQTGITIRGEIVRQNKQTALQFDCLWGWSVIRPAFVGRALG